MAPKKTKINIEETALSLAMGEITRLKQVIQKQETDANMFEATYKQKVEDLTARIRELEEENEKLSKSLASATAASITPIHTENDNHPHPHTEKDDAQKQKRRGLFA